MIDSKKVIAHLDNLRQFADVDIHPVVSPENWYIYATLCDYIDQIREEVEVLLKEQEAIEPIYIENPYTRLPVSYCSKCREPINKYITGNPCKKTEYCHYCGQAVKWE